MMAKVFDIRKRIDPVSVFLYLAVLLIAFGLKYHYSKAGIDGLVWILAPTASLVEQISGMTFDYETGTGFVNAVHRVVIAPSCAGVNFLIIAFCMSAFCGLHIFKARVPKLVWLVVSGLNAYGLTLAVNALRIILSIHMYQVDIYGNWITPDRVHRLAGIVIYFFFLCLFYMIMNKGLRRFGRSNRTKRNGRQEPGHSRSDHFRWSSVAMTPLLWYALITLGVPLINAAYIGNGARFAEHIGTLAGGCIIVLAAIFLLQWLWQRLKILISNKSGFIHDI
jgi:exosortase K